MVGTAQERLCPPYASGAKQQTRIAIRVKPVTLVDGMGIGPFHGVEPGERRYQHEQCRTRQMKICQQNIDRAETIARGDEDRGFASEWRDGAVVSGGTFP